MNREKLVVLIGRGLSIRKLATEFNCSPTTIRYWLKKYELKTIPKVVERRPNQKYCPACDSWKGFSFFYRRSAKRSNQLAGWCKECCNQASMERQKETKRAAVAHKGGSCTICGYNNYVGALEFHHLDPEKKDPSWNRMKMRTFEAIKHELDKCILLCSNCHRETHAGFHSTAVTSQ